MNTQEHFNSITTLMESIYTKKNHDYGDSFTRSLNKYGIVASIVRMEDKKNRIESLIKRKQMVNDESIIDTLTDLANYAVMTAAWMSKRTYKQMMVDFRSLCDEDDFQDILEVGILRAVNEMKYYFNVLDADINEQNNFSTMISIASTSIAARIWIERTTTQK